jgi:integrase/recombinase XerD
MQVNKVTTAIVLDTRYKKAAKFPVKLRVTHQKKQQYYSTGYKLTRTEWVKMKGNKPGKLKNTLLELNSVETNATDIIEGISLFSFVEFEKRYLNQVDANKLSVAFDHYIKNIQENNQASTAISCETAKVSLVNYYKTISSDDLLLSDITIQFLNQYTRWMESKGRSITTVGFYLRALRAVLRASDIPAREYPFGEGKYQIKRAEKRPKALSIEQVESIFKYKCGGSQEEARDLWIFQYSAGGMNVKDLCLLRYSNIEYGHNGKDLLKFVREKTKRTTKTTIPIELPISEEMKMIIEKHSTHGYGHEGNEYIFRFMRDGFTAERIRKIVQNAASWIRIHVKEIAESLGIKHCDNMTARHTQATILLHNETPLTHIQQIMGHKNITTTQNYTAKLPIKKISESMDVLFDFNRTETARVVNF